MIHFATRATRHFLIWTVILGAITITGLRVFLFEIAVYKKTLEMKISEYLEAPVRIGSLRSKMRGFSPELVLTNIAVLDQESVHSPIQFREMRLGLDVVDLFSNRQYFTPSRITVIGARFSVIRNGDGTIAIAGLKSNTESPEWLKEGGRYEILDSEISWQDQLQNTRLTFQHVNISLKNAAEAGSRQLHIQLNLPKKLGHGLTLAMRFKGNYFEPGSINGPVYIKGEAIQFAQWLNKNTAHNFAVESGVGDFELWSHWSNSKLLSLAGNIALQQSEIRNRTGKTYVLEALNTQFDWQRQADGWQLAIARLSAQTDGRKWPEISMGLKVQGKLSASSGKLAAVVSSADLARIAEITEFSGLLDNALLHRLKQYKPEGLINDLKLFANFDSAQFAIKARLLNINISSAEGFPGLHNFSATLKGSELSGTLQIETEHALFEYPEHFSKALAVNLLQGTLAWRQTRNSWVLSSSMLALDTPYIKTRNRLTITIPKTSEAIFLDFQSAFSDVHNVADAQHYYPLASMDQEVVDWLHNALLKGEIAKGGALFYGALPDFPFPAENGVFEALFNVKALTMRYDPAWPPVTDVDAEVRFLNAGLEMKSLYGKVNGAEIQYADLRIPSLQNSKYLRVQGQAVGRIEQGLDFMLLSPQAYLVEPVLDVLTAAGNSSVTVNLKVPLYEDMTAKVDVQVHLDKVNLQLLPLNLPVSQVSGDFKINDAGIFSDNIHGKMLGFPQHLQLQQNDRQLVLKLSGGSDVEHLQRQYPAVWWQYAQGRLAYDAVFKFPLQAGQLPKILLHSDLQGLALNLPEALSKPAEQQKPLTLEFTFPDSAFLPIKINFADVLQLALKIDKQRRTLQAAEILYGAGELDGTPQTGVNLRVERASLDVDEWYKLEQDKRVKSYPIATLQQINISLGQLHWLGHSLGEFFLHMQHLNGSWQGKSTSRFADGEFSIHDTAAAIRSIAVDLNFLDISALKMLQTPGSKSGMNVSPMQMPPLTIFSRQVLWQSVNLGTLAIQTSRNPQGLNIDRFELFAQDKKFSATGQWTLEQDRPMTALQGDLYVDDLGGMLTQLNISDAIAGADSLFDFTLNWPGAPYLVLLDRLNGKVAINMKQGRLLGVEPGFGRALGLLDFWQLNRRLQLDFSDLYAEGLSFNSMRGNFVLTEGNASTEDLVIMALPAKIEIEGSVGLNDKELDQIVTVIPKSSVVIPIAGTIVGRVADFIKQSLTGKTHVGSFMNSSQYALKGKWDNVQVIPLHENDGIVQKIWNGIMDIP